MAAKKNAEQPEPEKPRLAKAGAAGDAGVQNLLARRIVHDCNGQAAEVADIDRQLAELGYEV